MASEITVAREGEANPVNKVTAFREPTLQESVTL